MLVQRAYEEEATAGNLELKNYFYLRRGPYGIASVMGESVSPEPLRLAGPLIDLFDPELPVLQEKIVEPGQQALVYHLDVTTEKPKPRVLCGAARIYEEKIAGDRYSFVAKSPSGTPNAMRILLPAKPAKTTVTGPGQGPISDVKTSWDVSTKTYLIEFQNDCDGVQVELQW